MRMIDVSRGSAAENLAYEYCLMNELMSGRQKEAILYLWQNKNAVVIGRNQNPYKECDMGFLRESGTELARRVTGGGAVYHDLGNLNYSFLCGRASYDRGNVFARMEEALAAIGIRGRTSGRNDIVANGFKISGNAFYQKNEVVLHHGTILVNVDFGMMKACLTPGKAKLKSKGISSVEGRVANLADIRKEIDVDKVKQAICSAFGGHSGAVGGEVPIDEGLFQELKKKFSSEAWIYGDYPSDYETISGNFEWGNVVLGFAMKGTVIERCYVESDSLYPDEIKSFETYVKGMDLADILGEDERCPKDSGGDMKNRIRKDMLHLIRKNLRNG